MFCVRDTGLAHATANLRVPSAPHSPTRLTIFMLHAPVWVGIILSRSCFVCGTRVWCTPLLLCVCLQHLTPPPARLFFCVACTRLGWNCFISFVLCVRDKRLVHAAAVVRVPSAPHSHTRLTYFLRCVHASGLELFYLVRVLRAGQGPGARCRCCCAYTCSPSTPPPA